MTYPVSNKHWNDSRVEDGR